MIMEIINGDGGGWTITLNGQFFRYCRTYSELATTVGSLVKSKYLENADGLC